METVCVNTYLFEELTPEVQKKVLENTRTHYEIDCDLITELFQNQLTERGYPTDNINWSLSCCQGDGMAFYGGVDTDTLAEKDSKVKEFVDKLRKIDPDIYISIQINKNRNFHMYDHWNTMEVVVEHDYQYDDSENDKVIDDLINKLEDHIKSEVKDISKELEQYGYEDIEGQYSDENLTDFLTANEYRFTETGENKVYL